MTRRSLVRATALVAGGAGTGGALAACDAGM